MGYLKHVDVKMTYQFITGRERDLLLYYIDDQECLGYFENFFSKTGLLDIEDVTPKQRDSLIKAKEQLNIGINKHSGVHKRVANSLLKKLEEMTGEK